MFELARRNGRLWIAVRALVALVAFTCAFVDGLGVFLAPGQAVVWAIGTAAPHPPDSRWGIFVGLVLYAGLAFLSVVMRSGHEDAAPAERITRLDLAA